MPCTVFRFLQFIGTGYHPKLSVVVVVAVKYEIITIRESIPLRHNLNINSDWRQIRWQTTRARK